MVQTPCDSPLQRGTGSSGFPHSWSQCDGTNHRVPAALISPVTMDHLQHISLSGLKMSSPLQFFRKQTNKQPKQTKKQTKANKKPQQSQNASIFFLSSRPNLPIFLHPVYCWTFRLKATSGSFLKLKTVLILHNKD